VTAILGALSGEITEIVAALTQASTEQWNGFTFHRGTIAGSDIVVAKSGVGKTLSALLCQHVIDRFHPDRLVFTGIAGALRPDMEVGDTIIAKDCLQHDVDATRFGFLRGEIPHSGYRVVPCNPQLVAVAEQCVPTQGRRWTGRVLTGDQFITNAAERGYLRQELGGDAVEMEGASVGLVALVNHVPFLLIRTISDRADGRSPEDFPAFLAYASQNARHYLMTIMEAVG
jgi:5'-methylthioadenosine/S-adenosylhomocysteine nucleosidase